MSDVKLLVAAIIVFAVLLRVGVLMIEEPANFDIMLRGGDEAAHLTYIEFIQENGRLPAVDLKEFEVTHWSNHFHQMPGYYVWMSFIPGNIDVYRLLNILIFAPYVWFAFYFGREFFSERIGLLNAGIVAVFPMFLQISINVENSMLMGLFCLIAFWLLYKDKSVWLAAIFMGLALLTKANALMVLPFLALYLLFWKKDWSKAGIFIVLALLMATPFLVRNGMLYGNATGQQFFLFCENKLVCWEGTPFTFPQHLALFGRGFFQIGGFIELQGMLYYLINYGLIAGFALFSLIGLWRLFLISRLSEFWLFFAVGFFALISFWLIFWDGSVASTRYLNPVLPLMFLPFCVGVIGKWECDLVEWIKKGTFSE